MNTLPAELEQIAQSVSVEKRNEVQSVLNKVFNGVAKMREQLEAIEVVDENDKVSMKLANTLRLAIRQERLDAEKTFDAKRSEVQAQMLSYKTEDALWLKAKQTMQILTKENEEIAKYKEDTQKRIEAERKELEIQERIIKVSKFAPELSRTDFEHMTTDAFSLFLNGLESQYNTRIEAERKAEEEKQAQIKAEQERIEAQRIENERLKAEADKLRSENEAKLKAEQEAKAKLEAELKAKRDAEIKAEQDRHQAEAKAKAEADKLAKAPIKKQLTIWVDNFEIKAFEADNATVKEIITKFNAFKNWAKSEIEKL